VGEIGIQHETFLYELRHWQVRAIIKGYRRRQQPSWEQARMNAFYIMSAQANLSESGVYTDRDLLRFPWEEAEAPAGLPDEDEVQRQRNMLQNLNKQTK
jgi:hypothetical protein